jgi:hypothetical protein
MGTVTLAGAPATATVTLSGAAVFVNAASYVCTGQNQTNTVDLIRLVNVNGTSFTITSQNNTAITVAYICLGN